MARRSFLLLLAVLCLFYAGIETAYVLRLPVVMDEFQGARAVHRLTDDLPYRDFKPYKTVLGYYLQLPALALPGGSWHRLTAVKLQMVALNALALCLAALALGRSFDRRAVLGGLALLVTMSTFIERSPDLRVDMLTGLAGLASLLLLIERRHAWAGLVCGVSFLISQKGVYYAVAANAALVVPLIGARGRDEIRDLFRFNGAALAVVGLYLAAWSAVAGPTSVLGSAVGDAGRVAVDFIEDIRLRYWGQTVLRNPIFYGLALAALWHLDRRQRSGRAGPHDRLLVFYGAALILAAVLHRQPWPYFFVLLIPTLWVLTVALFDGQLDRFAALGARRRSWLIAVLVIFGLVYPLARVPVNLARDNGFQRHMVELAENALAPGETYLVGVDMLWDRDQVDTDLAWLDRLQLARLEALPAAELDRLADRIESAPLKLVIDNYRIQQLPARLRAALGQRFTFYWGNLLLYAPILESGDTSFRLAVSGDYQILAEGEDAGAIDGRAIRAGETIGLEAGAHQRSGPTKIRLRLLLPELDALRDPRYRDRRPLFPDVYDY